MNTGKTIFFVVLGFTAMIALSGCCQQGMDELRAQNRLQQERISSLENELTQCSINLEQCQKEKETLAGQGSADLQAKNALISALEADLEKKKALIAQMQAQLLQSGAPLPPELNMRLQEFAKTSDMITFDESTGMLKFKSDLLFDLGSDQVAASAMESLKQLAAIMKSPEANAFDMVIVGHTDDVPIKKPSTLQAHPTNWHLSVHRAISVLNALTTAGISPERMAVKGYGEYRPVEPNKPNKGGNAANRRVEIYIVPSTR
ncbi:MAG TPA: OmpA family protein [Anaerohalosphaeraceae bacterium]|nr:OmpA family protein [Anaerohalosphaeraceae bacterium]HOL90084.1 OmpA family protein [Anaerohalosphaeraceae bacterium]HPP57237.1 OmpA family protein [Anaerohalosphaeraceae bacterium]